jgi:hypothetical protein
VSTALSSASSSTDPIFILGISQRSGTNFLFDLLCLHPDCAAPATNWEDFLVAKSDLLVEYVNSVYSGWRRRGTSQEVEDLLYEHLGNGLISVLSSRVKEKRLVTKTPSVRNLNYFFKLFPRAYLLLLVRDGRAVVESRVKTFGEKYETAMRIWADGANDIVRFNQSADGSSSKYLIVRYEDLYNNLDAELRRIFVFLGLEADRYDFNAAVNMPVRGSSVFHGQGEKGVHWKPVAKTSAFAPLSRWSHWNRSVHERFNWIAGEQQTRLGYQGSQPKPDWLFWLIWNQGMDAKWQLMRVLLSLVSFIKNTLKWAFGARTMSKVRDFVNFRRALSH